MNNTQILKIMELLEQDNKQAIKEILTQELLKENKQPKKAKSFATIKKFIEDKELESRPLLKSIMHKNNKQFICNGIEMYIFNTYKEELETLPQASEELSLNYNQILDTSNYKFNTLTDEHKFILEHLTQYINYCKSKMENKKDNIFIYFDGKIFNTKLLSNFVNIHENNFDNITYTSDRDGAFITTSEDITSILLAIRPEEETKQKCINLLDEFKKELNA